MANERIRSVKMKESVERMNSYSLKCMGGGPVGFPLSALPPDVKVKRSRIAATLSEA
jgi:hypothetical protein